MSTERETQHRDDHAPQTREAYTADTVPLDVLFMPSLKQIVNRDITPEEHARAIRLDELQRIRRWKNATLEERGRTIASLLDLVSAMNRFPPQGTEFPGFPGSPKRPRRER